MLLGYLAQRGGVAHTGARVQDVDLALLPLNRFEQAVEVVEIGRVAAHAGHVAADQLDGFVELLLLPARYENVSAFFHEPLGALQRHAARSARDDCNLTFELTHDLVSFGSALISGTFPRSSTWVRRRRQFSAEKRTSVVRKLSGGAPTLIVVSLRHGLPSCGRAGKIAYIVARCAGLASKKHPCGAGLHHDRLG